MIKIKDEYIIAEGADLLINLDTGETFITGEGGGGKSGGGHQAVEANNTLRSSAVVRIIEVVSEGPIGGLCGGARGILINSTPLQNVDGSYNFPRVAWDYRVGLPDQDYMPGFPSASSEINVSAPVLTTTPVVRTTSNTDIDAVKVIIQLPQGLSDQNLKNGDLNGSKVSFRIDVKRTASGSWIPYNTYIISGKTTSPYESQYRVERPAGLGAWDIRVVRITADSEKTSVKNSIAWARMTEILDVKLGFEDTAVIGVAIDAESVGSTIPTRSYMIKGRIISVPANYDPETRVYSGVWNGTFKQAWSDNPIWVLYDLLTHERYGMGEFIRNSDIDIYSFYDASVYNDELVPDGKGGLEPRFTFSALLYTQEPAGKIIQLVAGACNCTLLQINGKWTVMQDRPTSPSRNITNSNVVDGEFVYKSSDLYDRHTAFNVTWNDRANRYLPVPSTIEDIEGIARYGYVPYDLAAYGATTEGQAIRKGKWTLDTELNQTELVNFRMGLNGFDLINNDIVRIFDTDYTQIAGEGRIVYVVGTVIKLDKPIPVTTGAIIYLTLADGYTQAEGVIVNDTEETDTLNLQAPFAQAVLDNSVYIVVTTVEPRQFKILNLTYPEEGIVDIEAVFHDPNKYSRIELGINIPAPVYSNTHNITDSVVVPPTDLIFVEQATKNPDGTVTRSLLVSWTPANTGSIPVGYFVQYHRDESSDVYDRTPVAAYTIPVTGDGLYSVAITAFDGAQRTAGSVLSGVYEVNSETLGELGGVLNLYVKGTTGYNWNTSDLNITWEENPNNLEVTQDYIVTVKTTGGGLLHQEIVTDTEFVYTLNQNRADNLINSEDPKNSLSITVSPRDLFSRAGTATIATFTNNPPAGVTGLTVYPGFQSSAIQWNNQTESDVIGYLVWRGLSPGFTTSTTNLIADGLINNVKDSPLLDSTTYYYKVAAYDIFSHNLSGVGLNVVSSLGITTTPGANVNEYKLTGTVFQPNNPQPNKVSWTVGTVYQSLGVGNGTTWPIDAGEATWADGVLYIYYTAGETILRTTTLLTNAVAANKIIVATYRGGANLEAGHGRAFQDGSLILAGTVATAQLAAGAVLADNIDVTQLSSISSDLGTITGGNITLADGGFIRSGQVDFAQGEGIFLGSSSGLQRFSAGNDLVYMKYDGAGNVDISGRLHAASGTFDGELLAGVLDLSRLAGERYIYQMAGSYTVTIPEGKTTMRISLLGGSGGGGFGGWENNEYNCSGGAGGGSDWVVLTVNSLVAGQTVTVYVGNKGVGARTYVVPGIGASGTDGGDTWVTDHLGNILATAFGGKKGTGANGNNAVGLGGLGGSGANAGQNGKFSTAVNSGAGSFTISTRIVAAEAIGGTSTNGGNKGGDSGKGPLDINPPRNNPLSVIYAKDGLVGQAIVEFFNPNSVVLKTEYDTLLSALIRQGIDTV